MLYIMSQVRSLMVTGDNAQCGFYIAKECSMIAPHVQVLLADIGQGGRCGLLSIIYPSIFFVSCKYLGLRKELRMSLMQYCNIQLFMNTSGLCDFKN